MATPTVSVPQCPICGETRVMPLHDGLRDRIFGVAPGTWTLVRCPSCGAARLDPRPADEAIGGLYASYYTHEPPLVPSRPAGAAARARRALRNGHLDRKLGYALRPAARAAAPLVARLVPLAASVERGVRHLPAGGRLLDVGCGNGEFLASAIADGWDAAGIDLDPAAVTAGRAAGLDLREETVAERAAREPGAYAAVTLSHLIEHVPDPVGFLRDVHALLRPGGLVWIATPNLDAEGRRRFGADWIHLDPPRHLVLFDAPSLARALVLAGFTEVRLQRTGSSAAAAFRVSHGVRAGVVPANDAPPPPLRVRLAALAADARALRDRSKAEELVVLARRPVPARAG